MATTNGKPLYVPAPFLSVAAYAELTNESIDTVRRDVESGVIPTFQQGKGKKRFINIVALTKLADSLSENEKPWNQPQLVSSTDS